jgi:hypothetical protein
MGKYCISSIYSLIRAIMCKHIQFFTLSTLVYPSHPLLNDSDSQYT